MCMKVSVHQVITMLHASSLYSMLTTIHHVNVVANMSRVIVPLFISIMGITVRAFSGYNSIDALPPCVVLSLIYPNLDVRAFVEYSGTYVNTFTATFNTTTLLTGNSTTPLTKNIPYPVTVNTAIHELTNDDKRRIFAEYSFIWRYFFPVNGLFGLLGNALTMAALLSDTKRPLNGFSVYLVALAIADSVSLLISLYFWTAHGMFHHYLNRTECKLTVWLIYSSQAIGCWLIAAICVDRLTAVVKPLYAAAACTARRALVVSTVLYVAALLNYLPYLLWVGNRNGMCSHILPGRYWKHIYPVINMVMVVASVVVMVYCNGRIAATVLHRGRAFNFTSTVSPGMFVTSDSTSSTVSVITIGHALVMRRHVPLTPSPRDTSKDRHTLVILFLVTVVFLLFNLPFHVKCVLDQILGIRLRSNFRRKVVIFNVFMCMLYLNNSINFLLYCVSASKFRRQVARLFRCRPKRVRPE